MLTWRPQRARQLQLLRRLNRTHRNLRFHLLLDLPAGLQSFAVNLFRQSSKRYCCERRGEGRRERLPADLQCLAVRAASASSQPRAPRPWRPSALLSRAAILLAATSLIECGAFKKNALTREPGGRPTETLGGVKDPLRHTMASLRRFLLMV